MAHEQVLTALREIVVEGEHLRIALLGVPPWSSAADWGVAATELAMFYGQAFDMVHRALSAADGSPSADISPGSAASAVRVDALAGMKLYRLWMLSETAIDAPELILGMSRLWMGIMVTVDG